MYELERIGIHPDEIKRGVYIAESALEEAGLSEKVDALDDSAGEILKQIGNWDSITNSVIESYFEAAKCIIEHESSHRCTFYVNGWDSHFVIDDDEISPHREF